ncbi:MAG: alanyl-tRNA editing protein [Nanoarchaeota archaeon]
MSKELYLQDCYLTEFEAEVIEVREDKYIVLDKTAFYPDSGGQPYDTGKLVRVSDEKEFKVVYCKKDDEILHEIDSPGLKTGDKVKGEIEWGRRYLLMRMHTAAHVLSRVLYDETGANTSGNQLGLDKSRIDFTLENYDKEKIKECIDKANEIIEKSLPVEKKFMDKEGAEKIPGFAEPSPHLVQDQKTLRIVDIKKTDTQPCGGTHVDNIEEVGKIEFVKAENKGKSNRRVYYTLL